LPFTVPAKATKPVAELIVAAIEGGDAQYFVNDFLRKLAGA
jgi:hypothetical protein